MSFTDNQVTYTYSSIDGRLSSIGRGDTPVPQSFSYSYTPNSNLIATVTGPAHTVTNHWESTRDVLASKENKVGSTVVSNYGYSVNELGQRTNVSQAGTAFQAVCLISWKYDQYGQVISANHNANDTYDRNYQYDAIGNRTHASSPNEDLSVRHISYAPNALNQFESVQLSLDASKVSPPYQVLPLQIALTHDEDGNMTSGPLPAYPSANSALTWDAENRLTSTTVNGVTSTYQYDSQSRRISQTTGGNTTIYVYDAWNPIAEYKGGTGGSPVLSKTYTWGTDLSGTLQGAGGVGGLLAVSIHNPQSLIYYPLFDGNGNVSEYLDTTAAVAAHYEYDPFGNTVVNTDTSDQFSHRFSTKPLDQATGLYYYGYRYYDPLTGRWPSRDPIEERGGVNLYEFVGNDGIDWVDYLGFSCVERIVVQFDDSYELDAPRDKWKDGKLVQKNYYPVSGRQFSGQMNVYDKDGKNIGSYFVISGGHREPHRERGHDTPVPSGQYDVETKKGRRIGYHVLNVSGRGDIEIHDYGTTTGCIAVAGFSEFDKNMEETHKPCCGNKETVKLEVSYNMPADQSEPQGNRFSEGGDPGYKPNHPDENLPYPTAIPVPIASPWSSIRDVINRIFH